jgi:hypothetical protein
VGSSEAERTLRRVEAELERTRAELREAPPFRPSQWSCVLSLLYYSYTPLVTTG